MFFIVFVVVQRLCHTSWHWVCYNQSRLWCYIADLVDTARVVCRAGGFAAECHAGMRCQSTVAGARRPAATAPAWCSAANVSWAVLLTTKVRTRLNTDLFIDDLVLVLVYRTVWSAKWTAFVLCLLCITRSCQKCVLYLKPWQRLVDLFNIELCSVWRL